MNEKPWIYFISEMYYLSISLLMPAVLISRSYSETVALEAFPREKEGALSSKPWVVQLFLLWPVLVVWKKVFKGIKSPKGRNDWLHPTQFVQSVWAGFSWIGIFWTIMREKSMTVLKYILTGAVQMGFTIETPKK